MKKIAGGVLAVLLASVAWKAKDAQVVQDFLHPQRHTPPTIQFDNDPKSAARPSAEATEVSPKAPAGVRKCKQGDSVVYTDGECPKGSREQAVSGGSVTVVPGQATPAATASGNKLPHARDLLAPKDDGSASLRDQAMDRVINR
ncbi:MAG: hypothetical protein ACOYNB_04175 [Aquabacterium sp.]|uniref:hypothetical protein n=1 Tax=Aquabacterium sp. TaxID=1872578 RepID=UPI003BC31364